MVKITVNKEHLLYINKFCSKEQTRYWLQGVYFDPQETCIVATDGHRLAALTNEFYVSEGELKNGFILKIEKTTASFLKSFKYFDEVTIDVECNDPCQTPKEKSSLQGRN